MPRRANARRYRARPRRRHSRQVTRRQTASTACFPGKSPFTDESACLTREVADITDESAGLTDEVAGITDEFACLTAEVAGITDEFACLTD